MRRQLIDAAPLGPGLGGYQGVTFEAEQARAGDPAVGKASVERAVRGLERGDTAYSGLGRWVVS